MKELTKDMVDLYQNTNLSYADIARELDTTRQTVRKRLKRLFKSRPDLDTRNKGKNVQEEFESSDGTNTEKIKNESMSEQEFLEPYDWIQRVNEGLQLLEPNSNTAVIKDEDFRRSLEIPKHIWKKIKNRKDMKPYQVSIRQSLYWCQPETSENLRKKIDLIDDEV